MNFEIIRKEAIDAKIKRRYVLLYKDAICDNYRTIKEKILLYLEDWAQAQDLKLYEFCLITKDVDCEDKDSEDYNEDDIRWRDFVIDLAKELDCKLKLVHRRISNDNLFASEKRLNEKRRYYMVSHIKEHGINPLGIIFFSEDSKWNSDTEDIIGLVVRKFDISSVIYDYNNDKVSFIRHGQTPVSNFVDLSKE